MLAGPKRYIIPEGATGLRQVKCTFKSKRIGARPRAVNVGYEMLAGPQRDISPEAAAERLRQV
jgi:galactose-1-phosphate uridylyltransferase